MANSETFRVIIAGGRNFCDYAQLVRVCDHMLSNKNPSDIEIVSGVARGADNLGERYAKEKGYQLSQFPADWNRNKKAAGYIRNAQMADYADALIAFWDGASRGTKHMIDLGKEKGLKVKVSRYGNVDKVNDTNLKLSSECKVVHSKKEGYDIYIGRPSKWGNPFTHKSGTNAEYVLPTRDEAVQAYREWITEGGGKHLLNDLHELKGKTLGCWCKPQSCHGDILAELVNEKYHQK